MLRALWHRISRRLRKTLIKAFPGAFSKVIRCFYSSAALNSAGQKQ